MSFGPIWTRLWYSAVRLLAQSLPIFPNSLQADGAIWTRLQDGADILRKQPNKLAAHPLLLQQGKKAAIIFHSFTYVRSKLLFNANAFDNDFPTSYW